MSGASSRADKCRATPKRAGIPGDVRFERLWIVREGGIFVRNPVRAVIADDHEGPGAFRILRHNWAAL